MGILDNKELQETFKKEATTQLDPNTELYRQYIQYGKIWNCGDFQMAHKDIWYDVRGFEENMLDSAMATDTNLQKKICNYSGKRFWFWSS